MKLFSFLLVCILSLFCYLSNALCADERNMEREAVIWRELEAVAPAAVGAFKDATAAGDTENNVRAVELYRDVLRQAPKFDHAQRRLALVLAQTGATEEARTLLYSALMNRRSPENLFSTAYFLTVFDTASHIEINKRQSLQLSREAVETMTKNDVTYIGLYAECALSADSEDDFRHAVSILRHQYPNALLTYYHSALLAAVDEDWTRAEQDIQLAVGAGLSPEIAAGFLAHTGASSKAAAWRYFYYSLYVIAAWAIGLFFLFIAGRICSVRTLHFIENSDPNEVASAHEKNLRRIYKALIAATSVYYYISLPIVAVLVIALAGSMTFAAFALGRIPIYLISVVNIGALVTVYHMVRTLFIKPEEADPGRLLKPEEAPALWELARDVAVTIGTRPIDEVRVVPGTTLAVYERGTSRERASDKAHRILILGAGVLDNFDQNGFRAVLAHEYGHFTHRDTAGGEIAMRVNHKMMNFLVAMVRGGQAQWWNLGFWFLRLYIALFRRISHGATRLQEVMADRVAVLYYGAEAFCNGLLHVIERSVEFDVLAVREINNAHSQQRPLHNLYELQFENADSEERRIADKRIEEVMASTTGIDDTHPAPSDRFRLAERIRSVEVHPLSGDVWDLFAAKAEITEEMSRQICVDVNVSGAVSIPVE